MLLAHRVVVTFYDAEARAWCTVTGRARRSADLPGFIQLEEWGVAGVGHHAALQPERVRLVPVGLVYGLRSCTPAEIDAIQTDAARQLAMLRAVDCPCALCAPLPTPNLAGSWLAQP